MSVPIVLPCTAFTKSEIENSKKKAVALVNKHGTILAILRNPEIYANRKEEIVSRIFGVIDEGHPYIKHMYTGGDWLIGGEVSRDIYHFVDFYINVYLKLYICSQFLFFIFNMFAYMYILTLFVYQS